MRQSKLDRIATAHTLNDQAETVLLKLSRGAGTRGLAGIFPEVTVQAGSITADLAPTKDTGAHAIIRPLLGTPRAKIEAFLNDLGQSWREDATNQELHHTRNRIRHKVLPLLESEANPNILGTLAETAEIAHAEETYWDQLTREHLQSCFEIGFAGGKLDCEKVRKLPLALQRRLVRAGGEAVGLHLEFHHVEQVLDLLGSGPPATLPDGWNAHRRNQAICFERESDGNPCSFPLQVPGEVRIGTLRIVASKVSSSQGLNASEPLLDCSFAASGLVVRNWHEGERFWPAHRKQARKIKELLQDRHVTGPAKKKWPVIAAGEHIVWVRGFGVGQQFISKEDAGVLIREISTEQESTSTSGSPNRPCGP
jgi:tRNA(Ile)-lysidine synthase